MFLRVQTKISYWVAVRKSDKIVQAKKKNEISTILKVYQYEDCSWRGSVKTAASKGLEIKCKWVVCSYNKYVTSITVLIVKKKKLRY